MRFPGLEDSGRLLTDWPSIFSSNNTEPPENRPSVLNSLFPLLLWDLGLLLTPAPLQVSWGIQAGGLVRGKGIREFRMWSSHLQMGNPPPKVEITKPRRTARFAPNST